ncbi:MAG: acyltransferase [Candidatus Obscuribacterales bacterium]|nr:acyltransferase [Candidatus Obscuribacterales bacterium]
MAVLFVHLYSTQTTSMTGELVLRIAQFGGNGVDLFLVLSGFLITTILLNGRHKPQYFRNFYARRMLRIFPLAYFYLVLAVVVPAICFPSTNTIPLINSLWLFAFASNIAAYLHIPIQWTANHFWSLAFEEQFYAIWPWVVRWCSVKALTLITIFMLIILFVCRLLVISLNWDHQFPFYMRCDGIPMGALLAVIYKHRQSAETARLSKASLFGIILLLAGLVPLGLAFHGRQHQLIELIHGTVSAALFGMMLLFALSTPPSNLIQKVLGSSFLRTFGKYSYGLYVFHPAVAGPLESFCSVTTLQNLFHSDVVGSFVWMLGAILISFSLALLSWNFIETPFLKMKKHFDYS